MNFSEPNIWSRLSDAFPLNLLVDVSYTLDTVDNFSEALKEARNLFPEDGQRPEADPL